MIRIGNPPRLPRRVRIARVYNQLGRYALAWGVVGFACWWIADVHMALPGMAIAAMLANPWRPKRRMLAETVKSWRCYRCGQQFIHARLLVSHLTDIHNEQPALSQRPARPVRRATRRAVHSRPWRFSPRRSVTPLTGRAA